MNANLFQPIQINFGSLVPTATDEFSIEWCKKIAALETRGCGFAGSAVVSLQLIAEPPVLVAAHGGLVRRYEAQASFSLPNNAYGTVCPPMLYSMVQYGTRIYYKRFEDPLYKITYPQVTLPGNPPSSVPSAFVTSIDNLHYDEISAGTSRWSFIINHKYIHGNDQAILGDSLFETRAPQRWKSPYLRMRTSHWPSINQLIDEPSKNKIILYYYSIGVDPNLV